MRQDIIPTLSLGLIYKRVIEVIFKFIFLVIASFTILNTYGAFPGFGGPGGFPSPFPVFDDVPIPGTPGTIEISGNLASGTYTVVWGHSLNTGGAEYQSRYEVYESKNAGSWVHVATIPVSSGLFITTPSYVAENRSDGSYRYRVRAVNRDVGNGNLKFSAYRTSAVYSVLRGPSPPSTITVPPGTDIDGAYTVSWGAASGNSLTYKLYERKRAVGSGTAYGTWSLVYSGSARSKALSGRADGYYDYYVVATNASGTSLAKHYDSEKYVLKKPGVPSSIAVPTGTDIDGAYTVSWGAASGSLLSYKLYERKRAVGSGTVYGSWAQVYAGSSRSKALGGRADGYYDYYVVAYNASGTSGARHDSGEKYVLRKAGVPSSITVPTGTDIDGAYTVSWGAAPGSLISYKLYERKRAVGSGTVYGSWAQVYAGSSRSKALGGRADGYYDYYVVAYNGSGTSAARHYSDEKYVLRKAGVPSSITVPTGTDIDGAYTVSWGAASGSLISYKLYERKRAVGSGTAYGNWAQVYAGSARSKALSGRADGYYDYYVVAYNGSGTSAARHDSGEKYVLRKAGVPSSIAVPTGTDIDGAYTVSWGAASGSLISYKLYERKRAVGSGTAYGSWAQVYAGSSRSKALSGRADGYYDYYVVAYNGSGTSAARHDSGEKYVLRAPLAPSAISISVVNNTNGSYSISWNTSTGSAISFYKLEERYRANANLSWGAYTSIYTGAALSSARSGLTDGQRSYRVQACNASGCSAYKNSSNVSILKLPAAPTSVTAIQQTNGSVSASWSEATGTIGNYEIRQQKNSNAWSAWSSAGTSLSKSYTNQVAANYKYEVRACNGTGCSTSASTSVEVTYSAPATPSSISVPANVEATSYPISWSSSSGVTSYQISQSTGNNVWSSWESVGNITATQANVSGAGAVQHKVRACKTVPGETLCSGERVSSVVLITLSADWSTEGGTVQDANWNSDTVEPLSDNTVGALAGEAGVSGGSATYNIPIVVPPGRNGMQPAVSLSYSSDRGNGIAGSGWSLAAGSVISRCGRTVAHDGVNDKVHFDYTKDKLCFNGQRLILESGTYFNNGAIYKTEINNFAVIRQVNGYFEVTYKNGYKDYFGQTTDSRHKLDGITATNSWNISKSTDVSGKNTISYEYTSHGKGEYTLAKIHYTGDGVNVGDRHVEFIYEDRPDKTGGYQSGGEYASTKRLKTVSTKYQSQLVKKYSLNYGSVSASSGNSLLRSVEECGYKNGIESCLPQTNFNWHENAPEYKLEKIAFENTNGSKVWVGENAYSVSSVTPSKDMNGDGTLDWRSSFVNAEGKIKSANTSFGAPNCFRTINGQSICHNADFNLDGTTDKWKANIRAPGGNNNFFEHIFQYAYTVNGQTGVWKDTPIKLRSLNTYTKQYSDRILSMSDFNGDSLPDIVVYRYGGVTTGNNTESYVYVYLHSGNNASPYVNNPQFVYTIPGLRINTNNNDSESVEVLGDLDGNGLADLFVYQTLFDYRFRGGLGSSDRAGYFYKPRFKKAVLSLPSSTTYLSVTKAYSEGTVNISEDFTRVPRAVENEQLFDFNGDGLLDIMGGSGILGHFGPSSANSSFSYKLNLGNGEFSDWLFMQGDGAVIRNSLEKGYVKIRANLDEASDLPTTAISFNEYWNEPRWVNSVSMDYNMDGQVDMLIPTERVVSHCFNMQILVTDSPTGYTQYENQRICDEDMYRIGEDIQVPGQGPLSNDFDRSVYKFSAVEFTYEPHPTSGVPVLTAQVIPTDIIGTLDQMSTVDAFGNGHTDMLTIFRERATTHGTSVLAKDNGTMALSDISDAYGNPLEKGGYILRNVGSFGSTSSGPEEYEVVDKLKSVETGLAVKTEWDYQPLNSCKNETTSAAQHNCDFYSVDHDFFSNMPGYLPFSANINVVSEIRTSNAVGGDNTTQYRYKDAVLNVNGRGFQGFRTIITDDLISGIRQVSDYYQAFPIAGNMNQSRTCLIEDNDLLCTAKPISRTDSNWQFWANNAITNKVIISEDSQAWAITTGATYTVGTENTIETVFAYQEGSLGPRDELYTKTSTAEYDIYGNVVTATSRYSEDGANVNESITTTQYAAPANDWVNKPLHQTVLTKTVFNRNDSTILANVDALSDHQKEIKTTYNLWHDTHRQPKSVTTTVLQGGGESSTVNTQYNIYGLPTSVSVIGTDQGDPMEPRTTTSTYSADGYFLKTVTNAKGHVTTTQVEEKFGQPISATDPNGQVSVTSYDAFGRVRSTKGPGTSTQWVSYAWCSSIANCDDPLSTYRMSTVQVGSPNTFSEHDQLGRVLRAGTSNFAANGEYVTTSAYDARGLMVSESAPRDTALNTVEQITEYVAYDALGRLLEKLTPQTNNTKMRTTYTYKGFVTDVRAQSFGADAKILDMSRKYNGLDQLVWTKDAYGSYTSYAYDGTGNPIALQDAKQSVIATRFNALGQKEWVKDPNMGTKTFIYNSLGELMSETDANGNELSYEYDTLGRMTQRNVNSLMDAVWTWDEAGVDKGLGLLSWEENGGTYSNRLRKTYFYSNINTGRKVLEKVSHRFYTGSVNSYTDRDTLYFTDSNYGRPSGMTYGATGLTLQYVYNNQGYKTHVKNASTNYVYQEITSTDAFGNITGNLLANSAISQTQEHHLATGQMLANRASQASSGIRQHELVYNYDGFGNLSMQSTRVASGDENFETFQYDNLHRMTSSERSFMQPSDKPNVLINYEYDEVGNIKVKDDYVNGQLLYGNASRSAGGNAGPNAVRSVNRKEGGLTSYAYDNNGNMLSGDDRSISYNVFNKPLTISKDGSGSVFAYGADIMRFKQVKQLSGGGTEATYYVDKLMEIEHKGTDTIYRHYLGGSVILNKTETNTTSSWNIAFNLKDRLGSVITLADELGNVMEHRSYDPFGKPRRGDYVDASKPTIEASVNEDPHSDSSIIDPHTNRGFTDHEHLDNVELIHMNGRAYDYNLGRFTGVDPFIHGQGDSQGINAYSYVFNNPLSGTDPTGYKPARKGTTEHLCGKGNMWGCGTTYVNPGKSQNSNGVGASGLNFDGDGGVVEQEPPMQKPPEEESIEEISRRTGGRLELKPVDIAAIERENAEAERQANLALMREGTKVAVGAIVPFGDAAVKAAEGDYKGAAISGLSEAVIIVGTAGVGYAVIKFVKGTAKATDKVLDSRKVVKCFPAGTLILMADGSSKPIEEVKIGDSVFAMDVTQNNYLASKEITDTHTSQTMNLYVIEYDTNGDGVIDSMFKATGEHPIWTKNSGWKDAKDLVRNDYLQSNSDKKIKVMKVYKEYGYSPTYNLSVFDINTFFIVVDNVPVLVHNTEPKIHTVAPDWATKGAHVTTSNGLEIKISGAGKGQVKVSEVFARDKNSPKLKSAINETKKALNNSKWRDKLLDQTEKATKMLGQGSALERAGSGGTKALETSLKNWCE